VPRLENPLTEQHEAVRTSPIFRTPSAASIRRRGNEILRSEEKPSLLTTLLPLILYEVASRLEKLLTLGFDKRNQLTRDGEYIYI
jgi:hypothetical protein